MHSSIAAKSEVVVAGATGPASTCLLTPTLLRVEIIFERMRVGP